jgi:hypothetical protein
MLGNRLLTKWRWWILSLSVATLIGYGPLALVSCCRDRGGELSVPGRISKYTTNDPDGPPAEVSRSAPPPVEELRRLGPVGLATMGWPHGVSYSTVRDVLDLEDLPALYQALDDEDLRPYWYRIAEVIAYVSDRPNTESAEALLRYARRNDGWELLQNKSHQRMLIMGKARAVAWVGLVGGPDYYGLLRKVLTQEGAIELAAEWMNAATLPRSWGRDPSELIGVIQGRAALGLVYTGDAENLRLLEATHESEGKKPHSERRVSKSWSGLVSAMATKAFIEDHGAEAWLELQGDSRQLDRIRPYIYKSRVPPTNVDDKG